MTDKRKEESQIQDIPASQIDLVSGGVSHLGEIQSSYSLIGREDTKNGGGER